MRGNAIISATLISAVVVATMIVTYQAISPKINEMISTSNFETALSEMESVYSSAKYVFQESTGARKYVDIYVPGGTMILVGNNLIYRFYSRARIIDPGASKKFGNVLVSGGFAINEYNDSISYYIDNGRILISLKKISGNINASDLINYVQIGNNKYYPKIDVDIDHDPSTAVGTGYTEVVNVGNGYDYLAHVNNEKFNYTVSIELMPGWDYFHMKILNLSEN